MKTIILFLLASTTFAQLGAKVGSETVSGLQGEWVNSSFGFEMKLNLNTGGKGFFDEEPMSYSISGNKLIIKGQGTNETYTYKLSGNNLTLSGGDLDQEVTFTKARSENSPKTTTMTSQQPISVSESNNDNTKLIGQWTTNGADLEFKANGKGLYNGSPFTYTLNGNTLISRDQSGENRFVVMFLGKSMTLMGSGINATFVRGHGGYKSEAHNADNNSSTNYSSNGTVDQSIAGKWCYVSSLTNTSASSSYSRCLNISANGTYTYQAEGSISGYGGGYYGGSNSQSADNGTWRLSGNRIYVNSRSEGNKVYSFEKRNHPKTGEAMIIIDGDAYVTYYQRRPW